MGYTLTNYDAVKVELPKPPVPPELVEEHIVRMMEPFGHYTEVEEERPVGEGDYIVVTTADAALDGNPASNFNLEHTVYHLGAGEMPKAFDEAIYGMTAGEGRQVSASIASPLDKDARMTLTMHVDVEHLLVRDDPELTDAFVAEHFAPATTVAELRKQVAGEFSLPDMAKNDERFPDLVLAELADRLVEVPDEADRQPGMPDDALRIACAIDAMADHLDLDLTEDQVIAQMPAESDDARRKLYQQLLDKGMKDEALRFARREAALSWLVNHSSVSFV